MRELFVPNGPARLPPPLCPPAAPAAGPEQTLPRPCPGPAVEDPAAVLERLGAGCRFARPPARRAPLLCSALLALALHGTAFFAPIWNDPTPLQIGAEGPGNGLGITLSLAPAGAAGGTAEGDGRAAAEAADEPVLAAPPVAQAAPEPVPAIPSTPAVPEPPEPQPAMPAVAPEPQAPEHAMLPADADPGPMPVREARPAPATVVSPAPAASPPPAPRARPKPRSDPKTVAHAGQKSRVPAVAPGVPSSDRVTSGAGVAAPDAFGAIASSSSTGGTAGDGRRGASNPAPLGPTANPKPAYPELARQRGQEGTVVLLVDVGADGTAAAVTVRQSSGFTLLDRAAQIAVQRWRFKPARLAGVSVPGRVEVPVAFRLRE